MSSTITRNGKPYISSPLTSEQQVNLPPSPAEESELLLKPTQYTVKGSLPNTPLGASVISTLLGGLVFGSLALASHGLLLSLGAYEWTWARPRLGIYLAFLGIFHLFEFYTTAGWNSNKLSVDAFLLNNTNQYHYAHAFGLTEYFLSSYFFPKKFTGFLNSFPILAILTVLLIATQTLRSLAMIHASKSFHHVVQTKKNDDHVLVTKGVYAYSRHPSYVGFFYWAVCTQLLLGNIVSTTAFIVILGRFFSARIASEEKYLVQFFGNDYIEYRKKVGTGLPAFLGWF